MYISTIFKHINFHQINKTLHIIISSHFYLHINWFPHKCTHMQTMDFIGETINLKNNILYTITYMKPYIFRPALLLLLMQKIKISKISLDDITELNCVPYLLFIATKYVHFSIYHTCWVPIPGIRDLSIDLRCWPL